MPVLCRPYVSRSGEGNSKSRDSSGSPRRDAALASSSKPRVYAYQHFAPGEDWFPSPMVPIAMQGPAEPIVNYALADTGADSTALPLKEAKELGIDLEKDCRQEVDRTAGGKGMQFVYEPGLAAQIEDVQFPLSATFMDTPVIILGQEDFFKHFKVTFDHRAQQITLRPY